jgi:hypothetical protein
MRGVEFFNMLALIIDALLLNVTLLTKIRATHLYLHFIYIIAIIM